MNKYGVPDGSVIEYDAANLAFFLVIPGGVNVVVCTQGGDPDTYAALCDILAVRPASPGEPVNRE